MKLPIIDIGTGDDKAIAAEIDKVCREVGFFAVTGHGVPEEMIARTRAQAETFFALPEAEKLKVKRPPQKISRGYNPFADRSLSYSLGIEAPPDLQEAFAFGQDSRPAGLELDGDAADAMWAPNLWPDDPPGFGAAMMDYYETMNDLGMRVLAIMTHALGVEKSFFEDKFDHHAGVARAIHYPAQQDAPVAGQIRAGVHTDYGAVTFVRGDNVPGGLQVKHRHGDWIDVETPPGAFMCNIADAMERWTNDRWVSTLHRVGNPPVGAANKNRISLVFFHSPNHDAVISCLPSCAGDGEKYPPVTFAEHYLTKVMRSAHARTDAGVEDATAESA